MTSLRLKRSPRRRHSNRHFLELLEQRLVLAAPAPLSLTLPIESEFVSSYYDLDFAGDPSDPEGSARAFLSAASAALGMKPDTSDLQLIEVKQGLRSSHTRLEQTLDGRPVHGALVSVHQAPDGSVQTLHTQYYPQISAAATDSIISLEAATDSAVAATQARRLRSPVDGQLVWYPQDQTTVIPAWRMTVSTADPIGHFLTLVDARTGDVISQHDRLRFLTGTGMVFQPNPHQTQGSGAFLNDNSDANSAALEAQLVPVALEGLEAFSGLLKGEFADVASLNSRALPDVDANEPTRVYNYTRDDPRFEQVVVYDTVDAMQRYIHSLGYDDDTGAVNGIRDFPTIANAHWVSSRGAFYDPANDGIFFLDESVDAAEDADVVAHEYGHAIQFDQNANFRIGGVEMDAMGEGFSDYWAASFFADQGDPDYQSVHAACLGEWFFNRDGPDDPPCVRRVDGDKIYPDDLINIQEEEHANGEIWSRALWDIRKSLGGPTADQLILEHHFALPGNATMPVAAQAMLDADSNLNGGINSGAIRTVFALRGMLIPESTPTSAAVATDISDAGAAEHTITVSYVDDTAIDVSELGDSDIRVSGPNGFEQFASFSSVDLSGDGSPRIAEYRIQAPGGAWDEVDNGQYTISMVGNQVSDTAGNPVDAGKIGTFQVDIREAPTADGIAADIVIEGATTQIITVTYLDNEAIDVSDIGGGDIRITGPNAFDQTGTFLSVNDNSDGRQRFARYSIAAPGDSWGVPDNGLYEIHVVGGQVRDITGNGIAGGAIGSFEVSIIGNPNATATAPHVTAEGSATHTVTVTYFDNGAIDVSDIGDGDIRVSGSNGYSQLGSLLSVDDNTDGSPRIAQYTVTAPGGQWDQGDNGTYTVHMVANEVRDTDGNAVLAAEIGSFNVDLSTVDGFGYEAIVVAPTFESIRGSVNRVLLNEDDRAIELTDALLGDFEFEFYGTTYANLFVSSNGLITFGGPEPGPFNFELSVDPNQPTIAVLWDDLLVTEGVYWDVRGSGAQQRLVVQWEAEYLTGNNRISFQAILSEFDGSIAFNYRDLAGNTAVQDEGLSATVGIKDEGTQGANRLLLTFNSTANSFVGTNRSTRIQYGPSVTLNLDPPSIDESSGAATITAALSRPFQLPVTVDLGLSGTATLNSDYAISGQQIVFPSGTTTGSVTVSAVQDALDEDDETVVVDVVSVTNGTATSPLPITTMIIDDDDPPTVSLMVDATSVVELDGVATFTAVLSEPAGRDVTVDLAISGTAVADADYAISGTRIVIPAGATTGSVIVTATQDPLDELDETVIVDIAAVTNGLEVGVEQRTTTILDDDDPPGVALSVDNTSIPERGGQAVVTTTLSAPSSFPITVDLETTGTATLTDDYVISATQILIAPGETSGSISVTSVPDVLVTEGPETVIVDIAGATSATENGVQQVTTTIVDDTRGPAVTLAVDNPVIGEAGGVATFTATLDLAFHLPVTIDLEFGGSATRDVDYVASSTQIVVPAGESGGSITVSALQDSADEKAENVAVDILNVTNGSELGTQQQTTTIVDDDGAAIGPTPANASFDVPASGEIEFTYADSVVPSTVTSSTFVVHGQQSGFLTERTFVAGNTVTRIPSRPFFSGEVVQATVTSGISTSAGAAAPHVWTFDTAVTGGIGRFTDSGQSLDAANGSSAGVALGDLDGDGDLDLFGGHSGASNRVYLNDGNGVFSDTGQALGNQSNEQVALGDLDGDGDLDGFVAKGGSDRIYLNDGSGRFEDSGQFLGSDSSNDVALGDLDGDGDLDAAVASRSGNRVWLNDGKGAFTLGEFVGTDDSESVALGDFDGDGDLDALLDGRSRNSSWFWLNRGNATFTDSGQVIASGAYGVALGDLDADGDLDVYVGAVSGADHILLNDGLGVFSDSGLRFSSTRTRDVTLGDVDADGDLDVFIVKDQWGEVWFNNGEAVFSNSGQRLGNDQTRLAALADVDNDGDLDSVILQRFLTKVWLNDNRVVPVSLSVAPEVLSEASGVTTVTATLHTAHTIPVTVDLGFSGTATSDSDYATSGTQIFIPAGAVTGTVTVTAIQDLIDEPDETVLVDIVGVTNGEEADTQQVMTTILDDDGPRVPRVKLTVDNPVISEAGGVATFTATLDSPVGLPVTVAFGFGGTATQELDYVASTTQIVIPVGESGGSISVSALQDLAGEPDENVVVDILTVTNGVELGRQRQTTTIVDAATVFGPMPANAAFDVPASTDVNFTFADSVVAATATSGTFVVHGQQSGLLAGPTTTAGRTVTRIASRPFFAGEMVQATVTSRISTSAGAAAPHVRTFQTAVTGGSARFTDSGQRLGEPHSDTRNSVALGDLDGDGDLDLFGGNDGNNRVYLNDGNGAFIDSGQSSGIGASRSVSLGDLDGDRDLDAFLVNSRSSRIYFNDGGGRFRFGVQGLPSFSGSDVALGDLDGDGDLDAVVTSYQGTDNRVWLNLGTGAFTSSQILGEVSASVALGDVDGDGDLDAFTVEPSSRSNRLWLNRGNGTFLDSGQRMAAGPNRHIELGDLDGDGDIDAYVGVDNAEADRVWLNDGRGIFFDSGQGLSLNSARGAALGDADADGDLDAFIASDEAVEVWLNDGDGAFSDSGEILGTARSAGLSLGDVDNDGDLDAVMTSFRRNEVWLNENRPASVRLNIDRQEIPEASGVATVTATLDRAHTDPVTIDLGFGGTATNDSDYAVSETQIVIPVGSTSGTVRVKAAQDVIDEPDETVLVDIVGVINGEENGTQQVSITILDDDEPSFRVTSLDAIASGFVATFNNPFDATDLNLYDTQTAGLGTADATLVGSTVGPVAGSLVVNSAANSVTFIKTGDPLLPDTYTVTLRSAVDGFKDGTGALLDGNGDGTEGDDYVTSFTVATPAADSVTVGIPDFVRGPGQAVNLPADSTTGIPVIIGPSNNVRAVDLRISYDPALIDITGATVGADAPASASVVLNNTTPGLAILVFFSVTPLPATGGTIVNLAATVPATDPNIYRAQQVLDVHSVIVSDGEDNESPVIEDDAVHLATFFADVSGNGRINAADAAQLARVAALIDVGLSGSPNTDPLIAGDITGNRRLNAADAARVAQFAALIPVRDIPPIPGGIIIRATGGSVRDILLLEPEQKQPLAQEEDAEQQANPSEAATRLYYPAVDAAMTDLADRHLDLRRVEQLDLSLEEALEVLTPAIQSVGR